MIPIIDYLTNLDKHELQVECDDAYKRYKKYLKEKGHNNYWTGRFYGMYVVLRSILDGGLVYCSLDGLTQREKLELENTEFDYGHQTNENDNNED